MPMIFPRRNRTICINKVSVCWPTRQRVIQTPLLPPLTVNALRCQRWTPPPRFPRFRFEYALVVRLLLGRQLKHLSAHDCPPNASEILDIQLLHTVSQLAPGPQFPGMHFGNQVFDVTYNVIRAGQPTTHLECVDTSLRQLVHLFAG
jgi:hypothetical protein